MSLHDKLGRATYDVLEMVKSRLAADLLQGRTQGKVEFATDAQFEQILNFVNASLDGSFANATDHLLRVAQEATQNTEVATKPKKTTRSKKS